MTWFFNVFLQESQCASVSPLLPAVSPLLNALYLHQRSRSLHPRIPLWNLQQGVQDKAESEGAQTGNPWRSEVQLWVLLSQCDDQVKPESARSEEAHHRPTHVRAAPPSWSHSIHLKRPIWETMLLIKHCIMGQGGLGIWISCVSLVAF